MWVTSRSFVHFTVVWSVGYLPVTHGGVSSPRRELALPPRSGEGRIGGRMQRRPVDAHHLLGVAAAQWQVSQLAVEEVHEAIDALRRARRIFACGQLAGPEGRPLAAKRPPFLDIWRGQHPIRESGLPQAGAPRVMPGERLISRPRLEVDLEDIGLEVRVPQQICRLCANLDIFFNKLVNNPSRGSLVGAYAWSKLWILPQHASNEASTARGQTTRPMSGLMILYGIEKQEKEGVSLTRRQNMSSGVEKLSTCWSCWLMLAYPAVKKKKRMTFGWGSSANISGGKRNEEEKKAKHVECLRF